MEIFVRSRGFSQEEGYWWLPQNPSILTTNRVTEWIQSEAPSLVLARYGRQLLLLVTGLESVRTDFRDRSIRNSVAWVGDDSEETESQLRTIAVRILRTFLEEKQDSLDAEIDATISFGGEFGFDIAWEDMKQISERAIAIHRPQTSDRQREEHSTDKVGQNCDFLKEDLAELLAAYSLPLRSGALVIVTGIKSQKSLIQAGVWRGLSKSVETEDWITIRERENAPNSPQDPLKSSKPSNDSAALLAGGIIAIAALILSLFWF